MPTVSVIMGVYNINNIEIAKESINSILNQTYKDLEFIICDDGSTNNTYETICKLTQHDNRCVILRNEKNKGLASALNHCLQFSRGKYIARMDIDDISLPNRLEEQIQFIETNNSYVIVGSWAEYFAGQNMKTIRKTIEKPTKENLLFGSPFIHPSVIIKKEALNVVNGYRVANETIRGQDYDLWLRLYGEGYKGYNIQKVLFLYREDMNTYKRRKYKYRISEAKVRYKGFKKLNLYPKGYFYVVKPLIIGLIPHAIIKKIKEVRN